MSVWYAVEENHRYLSIIAARTEVTFSLDFTQFARGGQVEGMWQFECILGLCMGLVLKFLVVVVVERSRLLDSSSVTLTIRMFYIRIPIGAFSAQC